MINDTTELEAINYFFRLESLKGVYGIIWLLLPIFTPVLGIVIRILVIVWLERNIYYSSLTYGTKLLFKEDLLPSIGHILLFSPRPSITVISILLSYSYSCFLWISISSIALIELLMSGYGSNNKYSFLGGLQDAAHSISYEIPLTPCVLSISLCAIAKISSVGFWRNFRLERGKEESSTLTRENITWPSVCIPKLDRFGVSGPAYSTFKSYDIVCNG
ncbi:hypothetical protein MKX03_025595 [Papaver bracteatum]|nr:hypothetical protein MKX03_025595 [Papaver bracteatum]